MKTLTLHDALLCSCDSGHRFLKKMFKKHGNGKELRITENAYNKIIDAFIKYHKTTKIEDLKDIEIQIHLHCFLDDMFNSHFKIKTPQYWRNIKIGGSDVDDKISTEEVRKAGWRLLKRCIK